MQNFKEIIKAILAGGAISLGGLAFICCQNQIIGSLFFVVGLFLVLVANLNLFTGKICYICDNPKLEFVETLIVVYLGNLIGCYIFGSLLQISKFTDLATIFKATLDARMNRQWYEIIILGVFCNLCIFIAVKGYSQNKEIWKKILSLFFGVSVFVLCGFEHCVADMFYITFCQSWSIKSVGFILLVTLGNIIGGFLCSSFETIFFQKDAER